MTNGLVLSLASSAPDALGFGIVPGCQEALVTKSCFW